ncbi:leukocyte receptor cluster member 9 isoform X3 [Mugil cephalus]|uniref:leukocyte receptor cluster member 9 isoform X3 n=1 Tax=Mugil cephalus TaxID=48193 RepID=UPI001FB5C9CB|nr:leukocyte receptor cluster member 9 isoform X3 [Mugil cephalus]
MASEGRGVSIEDQADDGTHQTPTTLTDTPGPGTEAGASADPNSGEDILKATAESTGGDEDGLKLCQFFLRGKCRFGPRCRLSHSEPSVDESGALSADMDDKDDGENTDTHKKKKSSANKVTKPKCDEGGEANKKPRMRTADDVISRILWDSSVDASDFVVGYVDRFLGVLERPFCDFNWDTNPCDCDYTTELALPRHRIQYFTYRGHRIWDRHSRTDRVFGSTGQSLAPPFGKEEEVKAELNASDPEQQRDRLETTEVQPPAVSGQDESETKECTHTENTHLEEEKQDEKNNHTPDSTHPAPERGGSTSQGQQESCVAEEAARLQSSADQSSSSLKEKGEEETSEEWEETWEGHEDSVSFHGVAQIVHSPPALPKKGEGKCGGRPPKRQPTHFITFRANTRAVLSSFQQLQKEIIALLPSSAPHWQPASSLHVTLCLLVLPTEAEVAAAADVLRKFAHLDRNPPVAVTFPVRLKHFNGRVLFLSPQPQLSLQQLNGGLQEAYRKEGWLHKHSYNPRYHLTLAKMKDAEGERVFERVSDLKVGKGLNFGRLPVNTLHLCAMGFSERDGFYETVCTVTLR